MTSALPPLPDYTIEVENLSTQHSAPSLRRCARYCSTTSACSFSARAHPAGGQLAADGMVARAGGRGARLALRDGVPGITWPIVVSITPFAAVFYPVDVLPHSLQLIAAALPASHVFQGLRSIAGHSGIQWQQLAYAALLNAGWLAAIGWLLALHLRSVHRKDSLITIGS